MKLSEDIAQAVELAGIASESDRGTIEAEILALEERWRSLEHMLLFSGQYDANNCFVTISGGAGGTEAQDWAGILLRMYLRYCERKGWRTDILEETRGQEAGYKTITIHVQGELAYGHLKAERGTHRLVRLSPFNAKNLRQTSFALAEILPEIDDTDEVEINLKDLRIDTFRAGGAGGQHVNKTDSAIRITYLPLNIVVACQNERSQTQNKEQAMKMLRAKLLQIKHDEENATLHKLKGSTQSADFGQQIRSYVLHPYKMVKDLRTDVERSDPDAVLDGDLDDFVYAELRRTLGEGSGQS